MGEAEATVLMMTLLILAGVAVLGMAMHSRRRIREMEHRERLAMIERGLMPSPELDPAGFEQRTGGPVSAPSPASTRFRSIGIITTGLGLGLMVFISFAAGAPDIGLGLGGAIALLGAAFIVNAMISARPEAPPAYPSYRSERREPPSDVPR